MSRKRTNVLNLPKPVRFELAPDGTPRKVTSRIRHGIIAPPGFLIFAADKAQIEARMVATLAGQDDLVEAFRQGRDVYAEHAEDQFGRPCSKKLAETDPIAKKDRDSSKAVILGAGFGLGPEKHQRQVRKDGLNLTFSEAHANITGYRSKYYKIPELWGTYEQAMWDLLIRRKSTEVGPVTFEWIDQNDKVAGIRRPNGLHLIYPRFRMERDKQTDRPQLLCNQARDKWPRKLYGGAITENVVQSLARDLIVQDMISLQKELGLRTGLQVYDEIVGIVPEDKAEELGPKIVAIMSRSPKWLPNLPVAVEIGFARNYGET